LVGELLKYTCQGLEMLTDAALLLAA